MRKFKIDGAYEHLKKFTQGLKVTKDDFELFIDQIEGLPEEERDRLKKLKPSTYLGLASELAQKALN